jgi:hypothetical protein
MTLNVFHTQTHDLGILNFPLPADSTREWLGYGYYFWQDYQFTEWWGDKKKSYKSKTKKYNIYKTKLDFNEEDFIDTVFNEEDYYQFVSIIEKFAKKFISLKHKKPTLEEFNLFIKSFQIWDNIKIIRFQDLTTDISLLEVKGYYYKKRIQIRVNNPTIIRSFVFECTKDCIR